MLAYAHINLLSMLSRFTPDEAVRVATDSIYVRKSALKRFEGVEAFLPMKKMQRGHVRSLFARGSTFPRSPQPSGVIRTRSSTCPWNMQPTSPILALRQQKRTSLPSGPLSTLELSKRRRGQRQSHASDRALPPEKSPRLHLDPSPGQGDAGQGRPGLDLPQLIPMEWPDGVDA